MEAGSLFSCNQCSMFEIVYINIWSIHKENFCKIKCRFFCFKFLEWLQTEIVLPSLQRIITERNISWLWSWVGVLLFVNLKDQIFFKYFMFFWCDLNRKNTVTSTEKKNNCKILYCKMFSFDSCLYLAYLWRNFLYLHVSRIEGNQVQFARG